MDAPGCLEQQRLGEQRRDEVAGHELAVLVDEEAAVGVAVPGDAEVGLLGHTALADLAAVLLEQRVGLVVGEGAVDLEVQLDAVDRRALEDQRRELAGDAVGGVHHDAVRRERGRRRRARAGARRRPGTGRRARSRRRPAGRRASRASAWLRCLSSGMPCSPLSGSAPRRRASCRCTAAGCARR